MSIFYVDSASIQDLEVTGIFNYSNTGSFSINGPLQLNPTTDPGASNTSASYFFVTSSGDNIENNLHYRNNGALWETHWLEERSDTGLIWGGVVTFTGSTIYVTPGAGLIIDHNASTGSHGDTIPTYVQFGPITASATYLTSSQVTYLLIDGSGNLEQQTTIFTPQQYNEKFPLGYIFCLTTSSISSYADGRVTTYGQDEQQSQFIRAFGPLKVSGFDITPQSSSLKISIASGRSYRYGGFYSQDPDNPSIYDSTAVATGSLVRVYRDPAVVGGFRATTNAGVPFTDIDPTKWDDGSGTLQTVGANEWTIQRLFQGVVNNISYVYYGQNIYSSLNAAIQSITTEAFEESPTSIIALPFIGYVIAKGDTTNLADTTNNSIINSGLFRNTAGSSGGGGVATTNINDLADVTITSPSNGQALVYNAGLWINSNPTSASYATTASYVQTSQTASYVSGANVDGNITGNANNITAYTINQNLGTTDQVTFAGITASLQGTATTASYVQTAQTASYVQTAQTASYVQTAQTASYVLQAVSASYAITASYLLGGGGPGSPGGLSGEIQYNNSSTFGGVPTLTYDGTTLRATGSFTGSFTGDGSGLTNLPSTSGTNIGTVLAITRVTYPFSGF